MQAGGESLRLERFGWENTVASKTTQSGAFKDEAVGPTGKRTKVPDSVARRVWIAAGGRCTFCGRNLFWDETTGQQVLIGQLAHIVGATKGDKSPRGRFGLPLRRRHEAENLMLLCYDQHRVIDDKTMWDVFTVERLRELKAQHEDRIARLSSMTIERSQTVLRLVGAVGDVAVDLSDDAVAEALLERNAFPDFKLRGVGDQFELDVRNYPGQADSADIYWDAAATAIQEKGTELIVGIEAGLVQRVSVVALARIPLLIELGNVLGEAFPVDLYPARKFGTGGFGWSDEATPVTFEVAKVQDGSAPTNVAAIVSVTGAVDLTNLPDEIDETWTIFELRPSGIAPAPGLDRSQETIDNFRAAWAGLLADLELVPGLLSVAVFPAVPATLAITLGRCLIRGRSPSLTVYDLFADHRYHRTLEVSR